MDEQSLSAGFAWDNIRFSVRAFPDQGNPSAFDDYLAFHR